MKTFEISPIIGKGVDFAKGSYQSPYGEIKTSWKKVDDKIHFEITVPVNTKASFIYKNKTELLEPGCYKFDI